LKQENIVGKPIKVILTTSAAIVFLIAITILILPLFIDPNNFKPEIASAVKEQTGRDLELTGPLKLSIFPWLGISTGKMALGNQAGFQDTPFATLEEGNIKVKLLPLLAKRIEVSHIVLKGLVLNLAKNQQGISNWDNFTATDSTKISPAPTSNTNVIQNKTSPFAVLAIGGITIENARINWEDQQSGKHLLINDVNLNLEKFSYDKPVPLDISLIILKPASKFTEAIKLTTGITVNEKLDTFVLSNFELHTTSEGENIPGKTLSVALSLADISVNMTKQTVKASGLRLNSNDLIITGDFNGDNLKSNPVIQGSVQVKPFSPANVMKQMGFAVPVMKDANAFSKLAGSLQILATKSSLDIKDITMVLDDSQIKGSASIKDFAQPSFVFKLVSDVIDLDRYLPPGTNESSKPVMTPAVALAAVASNLPVETLRKLNTEGQFSVGKLIFKGLTLQDVQLNLSAKNGDIKTQQTAREFYQGSYDGSLHVDAQANIPALTLNEKLTHVKVEPLLKSLKSEAPLSGIVDVSASLQGQGKNAGELKSSLNGTLSFLLKDSVIKGFNLQKIIDEAKALIKGPTTATRKNDQTLFSKISGTATFNNGLILNDDLDATASRVHISGKGSADLNTEKLDYKITARLVKTDATPTEQEQIHDMPINIKVAGTFSKPTYTLDVASLLTDKSKAKIEKFVERNQQKIDKIADKIDKKLGPGVGELLKGLFNKHKK
jgi:AsmA protein